MRAGEKPKARWFLLRLFKVQSGESVQKGEQSEPEADTVQISNLRPRPSPHPGYSLRGTNHTAALREGVIPPPLPVIMRGTERSTLRQLSRKRCIFNLVFFFVNEFCTHSFSLKLQPLLM